MFLLHQINNACIAEVLYLPYLGGGGKNSVSFAIAMTTLFTTNHCNPLATELILPRPIQPWSVSVITIEFFPEITKETAEALRSYLLSTRGREHHPPQCSSLPGYDHPPESGQHREGFVGKVEFLHLSRSSF